MFYLPLFSDLDSSSEERDTSDIITSLSKSANIVSSRTAFIGVDEHHLVVEDIMTVNAEDLMGEQEIEEAVDYQYFGAPMGASMKMSGNHIYGKVHNLLTMKCSGPTDRHHYHGVTISTHLLLVITLGRGVITNNRLIKLQSVNFYDTGHSV